MLAFLFKLQKIIQVFKWLKKLFNKEANKYNGTSEKVDYKQKFDELEATYKFTVSQFQSQIYTLTEFYQTADRQRGELATRLSEVESKLAEKISKERSEQVRVGLVAENVAPLLRDFPYESKGLRGLFNPIDYVHFGEDQITFIEVKTGDSQLSEKQRNIKRLVDSGKVKFEVHRMNEKGYQIK